MTQALPMKICKRCRAEVNGDYDTCPYDGWQLEEMPPDPLLGKKFSGKYQIESVLGKGGMSIVYKALDVFMDRIVAIKILRNHLVSDKTSLQRFEQEGQAAGSLNHPNIITVYDYGLTSDDQAYLIMECFEGPTLADILEEQVRITPERGLRIMRQICDGLEHAHKKGIIHRDLKPSNLCIVKDDNGHDFVKIVDFGIAKMLPQEGKHRQQLTQTGQIFGSPLFMSPEQCQGKVLDARSDLYSLGCLMYEALVGQPPFMGPTAFDTMTMHMTDPPKSFKRMAPDVTIPPELEKPIMRLLEKDPDKRYPSAAAVKADLAPLPEELATGSRVFVPGWYGEIRHNPTAQFVVSVCLLIGIPLAVFVTFWPGPDDDPGTLLNKAIWNMETSMANVLVGQGKYEPAKKLLYEAQKNADDNLDLQKQIDTANMKIRLGGSVPSDPNGEWRKYTKASIEQLKELIQERAMFHYAFEYSFYDKIDKSTDSTQRKKEILESRAGHAELIANELDALGLYLFEENLLSKALREDKRILGDKHWRVADLNMRLADCYQRLQHTRPIANLLTEALAINESKEWQDRGEESPEALESMLKLGQFYRDQSLYDEAVDFLKRSVNLGEKIYQTACDEHIRVERDWATAQSDAETSKRIGNTAQSEKANMQAEALATERDGVMQRIRKSRVLLIEAYNAYADYFNQLYMRDKKPELKEQSDAYFEKGAKLASEGRADVKKDRERVNTALGIH